MLQECVRDFRAPQVARTCLAFRMGIPEWSFCHVGVPSQPLHDCPRQREKYNAIPHEIGTGACWSSSPKWWWTPSGLPRRSGLGKAFHVARGPPRGSHPFCP